MSARSFRRERTRAIRRDERRGAERAKRIAMAAGGLLAAGAVIAPAANAAPFTVNSAADPEPTGRSMQIVVVSRNVTASPYSLARVAWMTSFCTSP